MKTAAVLFLFVFLIFYPACWSPAQDIESSFFQNEIELADYIVMPETVVYKIRAGEKDFVIYDVRPKEEYELKHVLGAVNLPWDEMAFQNQKDNFPTDSLEKLSLIEIQQVSIMTCWI